MHLEAATFEDYMVNNRKELKILLVVSCVVLSVFCGVYFVIGNKQDRHALYLAVAVDNVGEIQRVLAAHPAWKTQWTTWREVDGVKRRGMQFIHVAAATGATQALELLITQGAGPETPNSYGETPLYLAIENQQSGTLNALVAHGVTVTGGPPLTDTRFKGLTYLEAAITNHNTVVDIASLIAHGAEADRKDLNGNTPLFYATCHKGVDEQVIFLLLEEGADPNVLCGGNKETALGSAVFGKKSATVLEALIAHGAVVDMPDAQGRTPLFTAVTERNNEAVSTLLAHGADPQRKNKLGQSPLEYAQTHYYHAVEKLLSGRPANQH
jgi:ankyrin repeat protein